METKLLIPGPEYRRAVELLATTISTFNDAEMEELNKIVELYALPGGEKRWFELWNERIDYANVSVRLGSGFNFKHQDDMIDNSEYVAMLFVVNALHWINSVMKDVAFHASGETVQTFGDFVKEILADVEKVRVEQPKTDNQDEKT